MLPDEINNRAVSGCTALVCLGIVFGCFFGVRTALNCDDSPQQTFQERNKTIDPENGSSRFCSALVPIAVFSLLVMACLCICVVQTQCIQGLNDIRHRAASLFYPVRTPSPPVEALLSGA